jgi:hypothetical protein
MKRLLLWLILATVILIAFVLYRTHSSDLNVTPDARREIEKAKRR